ncbi:MAG: ECF transporter S component [Lachnospiraceae bacterium]|nr:ECF transporter S component [Lachnospiraceae bacterium]
MKTSNTNVQKLVQVALLIALQLVMKAIGLGSVPVGPLYMSFLTLPIAIGAVLIGPGAGAILGGVFGAVSFADAVSGRSVMTGTFFQISPISTLILCVGMRVLMGVATGFIFKAIKRFDRTHSWSYLVGCLAAPLLNTFFFMGYICLFFYRTDYITNLVETLGATNPLMFVVLLVGMQGLIEAVCCGILGTALCKVLARFAVQDQNNSKVAA